MSDHSHLCPPRKKSIRRSNNKHRRIVRYRVGPKNVGITLLGTIIVLLLLTGSHAFSTFQRDDTSPLVDRTGLSPFHSSLISDGSAISRRSVVVVHHSTKEADEVSLQDDSVQSQSPKPDPDTSNAPKSRLTSAVLNITYDGGHFHGWSAANDALSTMKAEDEENTRSSSSDADENDTISKNDEFEYGMRPNGADFLPPLSGQQPKTTGRKRRRGKCIPGITKVRSVEGQIRKALAKVYGNVDPMRVQIEGVSRTDKGVHARSMIALFYCLAKDAALEMEERRNSAQNEESTLDNDAGGGGEQPLTANNSIPGKRIPHPSSSNDDTSFEYLPFGGDIDKMMFVFNRMLPPDVRVSNISPTPTKAEGERPFHPTLDAREKTYKYTFSIGHIHDPMRWRHVWHVDTYGKKFNLDQACKCADLFVGSHDFIAFRGAFRGGERGKVQDSTVCNLSKVKIEKEQEDTIDCVGTSPTEDFLVGGNFEEATQNGLEPLTTYTVIVTGDRFLYKMVRFLVGSIVAAGLGKLSVDVVESALDQGGKEGGKEKKNLMCAPSHGLVLEDVKFNEGISFDWRV